MHLNYDGRPCTALHARFFACYACFACLVNGLHEPGAWSIGKAGAELQLGGIVHDNQSSFSNLHAEPASCIAWNCCRVRCRICVQSCSCCRGVDNCGWLRRILASPLLTAPANTYRPGRIWAVRSIAAGRIPAHVVNAGVG